MNILINYLYEHYPFTTASYYEMAARRSKDHTVFRNNNFDPENIDVVLNIEPVGKIIKLPNVPSVYYEIDNHVIRGVDRHFYDKVDLVLLAQNKFKDFYSDYKTDFLPLACWPNMHKRYHDEPQTFDIGFIGNDTYPWRRQLLEALEKKFRVLRTTSKPGEEFSRLLNRCKLTFNCAMHDDVNMRFFEAIASGRMLLTDYLPEQDQFATAGKHYVAYRDENELIEKVSHYLRNDAEREKIAKAGLIHIHGTHNYNKRLNEFLCKVKNLKS